MQFAGMPNVWWMPMQTRTEMLATGVRSPLGVLVLGRERPHRGDSESRRFGRRRAGRHGTGALVGLAQQDLTRQPAHVKLVCNEFVGEQLEQIRVRWRVRLMVELDWMDQASPQVERPDAIHRRASEATRVPVL